MLSVGHPINLLTDFKLVMYWYTCFGVFFFLRGEGVLVGCVACPSFSPPCYLTKRGGNPGQALASSLPKCLKRKATSVTEGLWGCVEW